MEWSEVLKKHRSQAMRSISSPEHITIGLAEKIFNLIDFTRLVENDTESAVAQWCQDAVSILGKVAGVCVYPEYLPIVANEIAGTDIKSVSVANFPSGTESLEHVLTEIEMCLQRGAQEIDVVFPYSDYLAGHREEASTFIYACKAACGDNTLKVILETGVFERPDQIEQACRDVIDAGADFIKSSTGKSPNGATFEAAIVMLVTARDYLVKNGKRVGVKISGGVREPLTAAQYVALADDIMGIEWTTKENFRIGSSQLVHELLKIGTR